MATRRYGTLDGLRGVAAFAVLLTHLSGPFQKWVSHGYLAVDLFFLMSGFVVAAAYEQRLVDGWGVASFALVRLKRLWPLYALGLAVGLVCYAIVRTIKPSDDFLFPPLPLAGVTAMGLLFLPQITRFGGGAAFPLNPAFWSLSAEIFGNLVYAAVARALSTRTLGIVTAIGAAGVAVAAWRNGGLDVGAGVGEQLFAYLRFAFSFPCGVLLYRLHSTGRLPRVALAPGFVLGGAALAFSALAPLSALYDAAMVVIVFPLLATAAVAGAPGPRFAAAFAWCGAISYPLYALHQPITGLILAVVPQGDFHIALLLCLPPVFVGLAVVAERWFDRPVQKWLSAAFASKDAAAAS